MTVKATRPLLVVADFDGTLALKSIVPPETIALLERLRARGSPLFTLATGRAFGSVRNLVHLCTTDLISEGGARRTDPASGQIIEAHKLDDVSIAWLEDQFDQGHIASASYAPNGNIPYIGFLEVGAKGSSLFTKDGVTLVTAEAFIARVRNERPSRVNFRWGRERITIPLGLNVALNEGSCDLLPDGINKATAVRALAERLTIPLNRVVVIGNDLNDLAMLQMSDVEAIVVGDLLNHLNLPRVRQRVSTPYDLAAFLGSLII